MDDLLYHAQQLANQASTPIAQPIEGRVAYVVNEGHSASNGSTQQLAEALNQRGLEALCIVRPGWPWDQTEGNPLITPEADINGVRYLHSMLPSSALGGARATLEATVEKLVKLLRVYRPAAVLAETAGVGLAAWIAAKRLGLAFYGLEKKQKNKQCDNVKLINKEALRVFKADAGGFECARKIYESLFVSDKNLINDDFHEADDEALLIEEKTVTFNGNGSEEFVDIEVPFFGATLELSATVVYRLKSNQKVRKAVLLFEFFDAQGNKQVDVPGIGVASAFKKHFRYLNANSDLLENKVQEVFKLKVPDNVTAIKVALATLGVKEDESISIRMQGRCYSEEAEKERKRLKLMRQPLPVASVHDPKVKRYTSDLTVACILDEFTAECLSHEVNLIKVTQQSWQKQIEQYMPDFLLVESCWKGNDGNWGTLTRGSGAGKKLKGILDFCKQKKIPTVFWNKEDPPHYDKFGAVAALFDLAITTDENMVPRYKADFGINVYPLSFGAQPKIHNPEPVIPRLDKAVFAGTYYSDKPKRCADFNEVMSQLEAANIGYDIFDRNYLKGIDKFAFPDHYQANIVGNLSPEEVWKAHKGYRYQVNMNSVQDSATMFARRVYESLASGTPVISNDSVGVRELFGDVVIMPGEQSIAEQLKALEDSPQAYQTLARRGVRAVMREHTYGHRVQALCRLLGMEVEVALPKATLAITVSSETDIQRAKQLFDAQTAQRKQLFIELNNFETAYQFLNQSSDNVIYAMQFAHKFYSDECTYYGNDRVLKHDVNNPLPAEALEDFIYWGVEKSSVIQSQTDNQKEASI
ncbi:hypothetical protein FF32_18445 [Halomonas campaniensis]|nr:hypothetical protein FF32_18445 [Halomonas campaniensis]